MCFVIFLYWSSFTSTPPPATVKTQNIPQATPQAVTNYSNPFAYLIPKEKSQDILQRANDLYKQNRYAEALTLYQGLAEQGNVKAQVNLGLNYWLGRGVAKDNQKAAELYRKAAEQGNVIAQSNLGSIYRSGQGVIQDYNQVIFWYSKAALQGHTGAQYRLGDMYKNGQGVVQNYSQAAMG